MSRIDIEMPRLGQSVSEGTVVKWLKKPGDAVARDEGIVAISTDKAEAEVPAPQAGRLLEIVVAEGTTVEVGTVLGRMETQEKALKREAEQIRRADREPVAPASGSRPAAEAPVRKQPATSPARAPAKAPQRDGVEAGFLSPAVRAELRTRGLDRDVVRDVAGSGRRGRVTLRDLVTHLDGGATAAPPADDVTIVPMTGMRAVIAEHMLAAKRGIPHVNTVAEIDMSGVVAARKAHQAGFEKRHGFGLSFNAFLLKAVATSLLDFPAVNAVVDERGIVQHARVHLGMAVALEPSGLVVPVVRNADRLTVREIAVEAQRLADKARRRQILPDDMEGGTCTVTNPGVFGNLFGTPIIHAPQAAIVDFGAIKKRVVAVSGDDGDAIAIRPMCYVVLAWDHRAMDGATAAKYLQRLVRELEGMGPDAGLD